jgi:hypothetical protein
MEVTLRSYVCVNKPKYSENSFTFFEIYGIIDNNLYFIRGVNK